MLDECLISILQYLIDSSKNPNLSVLFSYIVIIKIVLHYYPNDTVALKARQCLEKKLNNILEEMNREENHCDD